MENNPKLLLDEWRRLATDLVASKALYHATMPDQDVLVIIPDRFKHKKSNKDYMLMCMAVVHGVEVAGIAVQIELMRELLARSLVLNVPIVLALGNVPAFLNGVRFIDRDLNRSFGRDDGSGAAEWQRAAILKKYMDRSMVLLDLHQTKRAVERVFVIFPFQKATMNLLASLKLQLPVVTHWSGGFSKDGLSSDEYMHSKGVLGFTLELGQNGLRAESIKAGVNAVTKLIASDELRVFYEGVKVQINGLNSWNELEVFTWARVIENHKDGTELNGYYDNFQRIKKGEALLVNAGNIVWESDADYWILFPQYGEKGQGVKTAELARLLRSVSENELAELMKKN